MQNIDPFVFIEPILFIAISTGLVVYWRLRRRLTVVTMVFAMVAYAGAIALKEVVQAFTANGVTASFGSDSWQTGLYFGVQTSVFEVGLAYVVARWAVSRMQMEGADAEAYGISLAFWENGILLGALTLFNLVTTYLLIAEGLIPNSIYQTILSSEPSLFDPARQLAVPMLFGVLERVSSLLAHFAWGYLCVLAAYHRRRTYFLVALPMGLIDALVPFSSDVPLWEFEVTIFLLSLAFFLLAWRITRSDRASGYVAAPPKK